MCVTHHSVELRDERNKRGGRLSERRGPVWPRHRGACRDFGPRCGVNKRTGRVRLYTFNE